MDPFTAIGLAANVAQFVELAIKIVQGTYEVAISPTGLLAKHEEADLVAHSIAGLHRNIVNLSSVSTSKDSLSELDKNLLPLRRACITVGNELLSNLKKLKVSGQRKRWKDLRIALLSLMRESKIKELESRLMNLQRQIDSVVISDIQKQQTTILDSLNSNTQYTHQKLRVSEDLLSAIEIIAQSLESLRYRSGLPNTGQPRNPLPQNRYDNLYKIIPLAEKAQLLALQQTFLASLDYDMRLSRDQGIKEAHKETFQWIFQETVEEDNKQSIHFLRWLEEEDGVFWITGKPGSGKSTLMRYLWNEERTHTALRKWAESGRIHTACFYLWNSGTLMQRSLEGLLRSLLIQVLDQCPELTPKVFPRRWQLLQSMQATSMTCLSIQTMSPATTPWTVEELLQGFRAISAEASISSRFCFFIDGLDEYDGTDKEVVDIIASFGASKFLKFCLSSRPHVHFTKAYGQNSLRSLSISTLTTGDIRRYVHDNLAKNQAFQDLHTEYADRCEKLVNDIVEDANGVFLWVYLVVVRLLEGIEFNNDRMGDLERKLQRTPKELNQLFHMILDSVDSDYYEPQAHMFRVAFAANIPLDLMAYYFIDLEDEKAIFSLPVEPLQPLQIADNEKTMTTRISVRCKGLLEVTRNPGTTPRLRKHTVQFFHRTFRDFLAERDMRELMRRRTASDFDVYRTICLGLFTEFKSAPTVAGLFESRQCLCLMDLLYYAILSENTPGSSVHDILDEVQKILPSVSRQWDQWKKKLNRKDRASCSDAWKAYDYLLSSPQDIPLRFTQIVASFGLVDYTQKQAAKLLSPENSLDELLLKAAPYNFEVDTPSVLNHVVTFGSGVTRLIEVLLDMGANPNVLWHQLVMDRHYGDGRSSYDASSFTKEWRRKLIEVLLRHTVELPDEARVLLSPDGTVSDADLEGSICSE